MQDRAQNVNGQKALICCELSILVKFVTNAMAICQLPVIKILLFCALYANSQIIPKADLTTLHFK